MRLPVAVLSQLVTIQWLLRSILHHASPSLCTAEQAVGCSVADAHIVRSQHSHALQTGRASSRKNRTSKWVRARMPTIGSKPVPLATLDAREGGGSRGRTSRKAPLARGLVGEVLGAAPDASATPKDRYSRLRPLRPAAGVVRQKSDFRGGPSFAFPGIVLGAAPQTTFPLAAKLGPPRMTAF